MIAYLILYLLILIFYFISFILNLKHKKSFLCFFSCLTIIVFQSIRNYSVGIDVKVYLENYHEINNLAFIDILKGQGKFEIGYMLLLKIFNIFNITDRLFLVLHSILIIIPIFYIIYKTEDLGILAIITYMSFFVFTLTFSAYRQSIALSICFVAFYYIRKKKFFKQFALILLAMLFHRSAFIFFIAYPAYYFKTKLFYLPIILLFGILVFVFRNQLFEFGVKLIFPQYSYYGTSSIQQINFLILLCIIFVFCLMFGGNNRAAVGYRNIILIAIFIQIFANVNVLATRFTAYFVILLCYPIQEVFNYQKRMECNNSNKLLLKNINIITVAELFLIIILIIYSIDNIVNVNDVHLFPYILG